MTLCPGVRGDDGLQAAITKESNDQPAPWRRVLPPELPGPATGSYSREDALLVNADGLVAEPSRHGLTRARLDTEINAAAGAAARARGDGAAPRGVPPLTAAAVGRWPGRSGLHGSVNQCASFTCADEVVDFTIPWSSPVPTGTDLSPARPLGLLSRQRKARMPAAYGPGAQREAMGT